MAYRFRALLAGVELFALSLTGLVSFAGIMLTFGPGFGLGMVFLVPPPILLGRKLINPIRRRIEHRTGLTIQVPYLPAPAPPPQQADGWYRRDRQLYRSPRVPALADRLDWVLGDNATWRDLLWMLISPFTGALLGVLPAALVVVGIFLPWRGGWAVGAGFACVLIGLFIAPASLQASARFHRRLLGGPLLRSNVDEPKPKGHPVREWFGRDILPVARLGLYFFTSLLCVAVFAVTILGLLLGYGLGMFFVVPMVIEDLRWLADWRRTLAPWSGVSIPRPYRPQPIPPIPTDEGLYQVGRNLYKTRRWATWAQRNNWLLKDPATWREILWRGTDPIAGGLIAGVPVLMFGYGIWGLVLPRLTQPLFGVPGSDWYGHVAGHAWPAIPAGLALAYAAIKLAPLSLRLHGQWSKLLLGPSSGVVLVQRVEQLTQTRADASAASASELRRIERDLHDGAQSRLIAVGMSLAAVERLIDADPEAAKELLRKTRESAATALKELREVVRGIHPPVLAERGLGDAVRAMALDSPLTTTVTLNLPGRLPDPIEAAAYFGVAEALGNAAKHGRATTADISLEQSGELLKIVVRDNGKGGADPARGSGLRGLARRLGIFDGTVTILSPAGGPTELTLEIPCASSSPRTSTS